MTYMHGAVLLACLAIPLVCGFSHTCQDAMKDMITLAMTVAGGTLGHAGQKSIIKTVKRSKTGATKTDVETE